jgi:hypothetical protein
MRIDDCGLTAGNEGMRHEPDGEKQQREAWRDEG